MKLTGYQLREAIRAQRLRRETASKLFSDSLWLFDGQPSRTKEYFDEFEAADHAVATLEAVQQTYTDRVPVTVHGKSISLTMAVKLIGGAGRAEKMWRDSATDKNADPYSRGPTRTRDKDTVYANRSVTTEFAVKLAHHYGKQASGLRAAIASGNMMEVESNKLTELSDADLNKLGLGAA